MWTSEEIARCRSVLESPLAMLSERLGEAPYLLGQNFTVADLNVSAILSRNAGAQINLADMPKLGCAPAGPARLARAESSLLPRWNESREEPACTPIQRYRRFWSAMGFWDSAQLGRPDLSLNSPKGLRTSKGQLG
jgi:glutathione S-transferase